MKYTIRTKEFMQQEFLNSHPRARSDYDSWKAEQDKRKDKGLVSALKKENKFQEIKQLRDSRESKKALEFKNRRDEVIEKYISGRTLDSIGKDYGISRERVRQIIKTHPMHKEFLDISKSVRPKALQKLHALVCNWCHKSFNTKHYRAKYCSKECHFLGRTKHPDLIQYKHDPKLYNARRTQKYIREHYRGTEAYRKK